MVADDLAGRARDVDYDVATSHLGEMVKRGYDSRFLDYENTSFFQ